MAKDKAKSKGTAKTGNAKIIFGNDKKAKKTSIGKSNNSRKINKTAVREKKGR